MRTFKFLIGGKLVDGAQMMAVINPATEQPVADAPRANAHQINEAVAAAKAAFPAWSVKPIEERRKVLVHCRMGLGRSAMVACATLIALGFPLDVAYPMLRKVRPNVQLSPVQVNALESLTVLINSERQQQQPTS